MITSTHHQLHRQGLLILTALFALIERLVPVVVTNNTNLMQFLLVYFPYFLNQYITRLFYYYLCYPFVDLLPLIFNIFWLWAWHQCDFVLYVIFFHFFLYIFFFVIVFLCLLLSDSHPLLLMWFKAWVFFLDVFALVDCSEPDDCDGGNRNFSFLALTPIHSTVCRLFSEISPLLSY